MPSDAVMVFTSKSADTMFNEGGSGNWKINKGRVLRRRYVVAARNAHSSWTQGREKHKSAFLIGRISGIKSSPVAGRAVITFEEYATINVPNAWTGDRNPIAYVNLHSLGIDPAKLHWKRVPKAASAKAATASDIHLVFQKAKEMIAGALNLNPSAVEIGVRV